MYSLQEVNINHIYLPLSNIFVFAQCTDIAEPLLLCYCPNVKRARRKPVTGALKI